MPNNFKDPQSDSIEVPVEEGARSQNTYLPKLNAAKLKPPKSADFLESSSSVGKTQKKQESVSGLCTSKFSVDEAFVAKGQVANIFSEAAKRWFTFGFQVIPIVPTQKITALKWDPWLTGLNVEKIAGHWGNNPGHEIGFIVGDDYLVLDADSPEAIEALIAIEKKLMVSSSLVVKTRRGQHHYYRRAEGTFAKSDSHSTEEHPERIDVKTGRSLVILPPSTGKTILVQDSTEANELTEVGQEFIDAIASHNGRFAPRPLSTKPSLRLTPEVQSENFPKLNALLDHIDPDSGYEDWLHVLMAIYHETGGSDEGFALADAWSSRGVKYQGSRDIALKWSSFQGDIENPITIRTVMKIVEANGVDVISVLDALDPAFEICETEVVHPIEEAPSVIGNPLDKYSLTGQSDELEKKAGEEVCILGKIALSGQMTVFYASPNTGKTLLTLSLLIDGIQQKKVDSAKIYYLNMDDTSRGLVTKLHIAEEYGFHMLAEGHHGFQASKFLTIVKSLIENDQAQGVVIILDTLKKFVDLMNKGESSKFTAIMRGFVLKGGTVIALAHTNKNKGDNRRSIYAGTSDFVDDSDCAYIMDATPSESGETFVEFRNIKRRGNVVESAAYSYNSGSQISYIERLLTVLPQDVNQIASLRKAEEIRNDAEVISAVSVCIQEGIVSKMKLAEEVAKRAEISKRSALKMIEKYAGEDPVEHKWNYSKKAHGKHIYTLLAQGSQKEDQGFVDKK